MWPLGSSALAGASSLPSAGVVLHCPSTDASTPNWQVLMKPGRRLRAVAAHAQRRPSIAWHTNAPSARPLTVLSRRQLQTLRTFPASSSPSFRRWRTDRS
jgi:hypothetical protein